MPGTIIIIEFISGLWGSVCYKKIVYYAFREMTLNIALIRGAIHTVVMTNVL